MKPHRVGPVAFLVPMIVCSPLGAQTDRPFSLQVSGVGQQARGESTWDWGVEGQIRWTRGAWSLGAGVQYTFDREDNRQGSELSPSDLLAGFGGVPIANIVYDYDVSTLGLFLEPKFVVLVFMDRFGLYVSGRVAVFRMTEDALGTRQEFDPVGGFQMSGGLRAPEVYSVEGARTGFGAGLGLGLLVRLTSRVNLDLGATGGRAQWGGSDFLPNLDSSYGTPFSPGALTYAVWVGLVIGIG